jgi:DNA-binding transcriptional LysR family regulator
MPRVAHGDERKAIGKNRLMNVNFKLLYSFLLVAEHSSFRLAAEYANRSLPAISSQIKQLEEQLGVVLFHRTTRSVKLTHEGEQLLTSARKALAELEGGLLNIQQAADLERGRLSIACVPTIAGTRLPRILTAFAKKFPGVSVHVREQPNNDLLESVRRGEVDFGIGIETERVGDLSFERLLDDEYHALIPPRFSLSGRRSISLQELSSMPLLRLGSTTTLRTDIDDEMRSQGLAIESEYEFMQVSTLIAMAEAGLGVAVLPRIALPADSALRSARIVKPTMSRRVSIVTIRSHSLSPAGVRFVEFCTKYLSSDPVVGAD